MRKTKMTNLILLDSVKLVSGYLGNRGQTVGGAGGIRHHSIIFGV